MKVTTIIQRHRLLMGSIALLSPLLAAAAPPGGPEGGCTPDFQGPPPHQTGRGSPPPPGPPPGFLDEGRPPPFLNDVLLSDAQQDKVFNIEHAAAPALREQMKAARAARESLHQLVGSAQFNESAAASLAQSQGRAEAQLALLRARMEHDVYALLTPEQLADITAHQHEGEPHRGDGPPQHR